jgi:copper homeostasis protein
MTISLEICVDDLRGLQIANDAGVDRIELCSALDQGVLTPTPDMIAQARQADVPIYAIICPRNGDCAYDVREIDDMVAAIQTMKSAGFAGVVFAALTSQHTLDLNAMQRLCHAARGMDITLYRAVDGSANPVDCVEIANNLGIGRILTSGSAATAPKGVETLRKMMR